MKKILTIIAVILVLILMAITKPTHDDHLKAIDKKFEEYTESNNDKEKLDFGSLLGNKLAGLFVSAFTSTMVDTKDYVLFSIASVKNKDEEKLVSVGIFGVVIVVVDFEKMLGKN